jgi:hypothetical protein
VRKNLFLEKHIYLEMRQVHKTSGVQGPQGELIRCLPMRTCASDYHKQSIRYAFLTGFHPLSSCERNGPRLHHAGSRPIDNGRCIRRERDDTGGWQLGLAGYPYQRMQPHTAKEYKGLRWDPSLLLWHLLWSPHERFGLTAEEGNLLEIPEG